MKTFFLYTNACGRTYLAVARKIHRYLLANGLSPTDDIHDADMIVIDTCAYCRAAEDLSIAGIRHCMEQRHDSARVVVVGCLPGINPERLAELGDLGVVPPEEMDRLDVITRAQVGIESIPEVEERPWMREHSEHGTDPGTRRAFHVPVAKGCVGSCAYCAVSGVWGGLKSSPLGVIAEEVEAAVSQGNELLYPAAQDLGAYGADIGLTVVDLLEVLLGHEGEYKVILHDFNPQWFVRYHAPLERMLLEHENKVAYLDLPLQSGSDRILGRMRRPYHIDEVMRALFSVKTAVPDLPIEIDLMMGFPGETEEDFAKTRELIESLRPLKSVCFWLSGYSDRPGTAALDMDDKVSDETVMQRFLELRRIVVEGPHLLGTGLVWCGNYRLI